MLKFFLLSGFFVEKSSSFEIEHRDILVLLRNLWCFKTYCFCIASIFSIIFCFLSKRSSWFVFLRNGRVHAESISCKVFCKDHFSAYMAALIAGPSYSHVKIIHSTLLRMFLVKVLASKTFHRRSSLRAFISLESYTAGYVHSDCVFRRHGNSAPASRHREISIQCNGSVSPSVKIYNGRITWWLCAKILFGLLLVPPHGIVSRLT